MYFAQNLIGCRVDMKGNFLKKKNIKTIFFTEPIVRGMKLKLGIHAQDISLLMWSLLAVLVSDFR